MSNSVVTNWERCLEIIRDNVGEKAYNSWFSPITALTFKDETLVLGVPSQFFCEYLEEHYIELIDKVLSRIFGKGTKLMYRAGVIKDPDTSVEISAKQQVSGVKFSKNFPNIFNQNVYEDLDHQPNSNYRF